MSEKGQNVLNKIDELEAAFKDFAPAMAPQIGMMLGALRGVVNQVDKTETSLPPDDFVLP